ncbi:hypothetical protein HJD18_01035 [Thermoleophilia bacterium SCSIO 60948]|nr:hypothetical protein HJD18_01035 [Thermoleophilia bacterium SCSIO 60948]
MTRTHRNIIGLRITALAALAIVAIAFCATGPPPAGAGTYRVVECGPEAGRGDLRFEGRGGYAGRGGCSGRGLATRHESRRARRGARGGWSLDVPDGVRVTRIDARARGRAHAGHRASAEIRAGGKTRRWTLDGARRIAWGGGGAARLWAGLRCERAGGCGEGARSVAVIRSLAMTVIDAIRPQLSISGPLLAKGSRRGTQLIAARASDLGAGVHRVALEVNGRVVGTRIADCDKDANVARRLKPCPRSTDPEFTIDTNATEFRQGPNRIRVCAADWAQRSRANDACRTGSVRIDNACPISEQGGQGEIGARVIRSGGEREVRGRLLGAGGAGLEGRTVCVATRVLLPGRPERILATPRTGPGGEFRAQLGRGPNRELRIAFWTDPRDVTERMLRLREPARPTLDVRPRRVRNGERARFRVRVSGPNRDGVRVRLEARADGRWLEVRSGRTSERGRFGARYRFRATTSGRRYRFRALVPAQPGYPYARGVSPVKRIEVRP